ncbi:inorganic pyrophosphatase 2-like [Chenopodium quinoa]|nr:inorganic pyrophosphatase 2-like [Chenopodium quinoa]
MPYNSLMDKMMEELHLQGTTIQDITECLIKVPLSPNIISAIKSAYDSGCDLRIVSDANTFFIETILKHHGVLHCFSEINTNSAIVDEDGRLRISPFHDFNSSSHGCNLCPPNLCKGTIFTRIQASSLEKRFIYVGDGKNDYCPSLKLTAKDYVMPRKHFPLWNAICIDPALIKASIHEWEDGEELGRNLINLISSLMIMKADEVLIAEEYLFC